MGQHNTKNSGPYLSSCSGNFHSFNRTCCSFSWSIQPSAPRADWSASWVCTIQCLSTRARIWAKSKVRSSPLTSSMSRLVMLSVRSLQQEIGHNSNDLNRGGDRKTQPK